MTYNEIAKQLNITPEQVRTAERTGLLKLKRNPDALKIFYAYLELEKEFNDFGLNLIKKG